MLKNLNLSELEVFGGHLCKYGEQVFIVSVYTGVLWTFALTQNEATRTFDVETKYKVQICAVIG